MIGEIRGDGQEKGKLVTHERFRPMQMSESQRQRLIEMGSSTGGNNGQQVPKLVKRVIRIQALFRAFMVRKRLEEIRNVLQNGTENGEFDDTIDETNLLANTTVKEVYEQEGAFQIPDLKMKDSGEDLVTKGPFKLTSGAIYIGQWQADLESRAGKGRQVWLDGSLYEGQWKSGKANGIGRLIHSDGDIYQGDWLNDKANGQGKYMHYDGAIYEGSWKDDKQHGHGVETWPDEARYEGAYVNGTKHGHGQFNWHDGASYTGEFRHNDIQGQGRYTWSDGRNYEGAWFGNKMHGNGIFKWNDGRAYEGEFANDRKEGHGVLVWKDGRKYDGQWRNGKQDGFGFFTDEVGVMKKGKWLEGKVQCWFNERGERVSERVSADTNSTEDIVLNQGNIQQN